MSAMLAVLRNSPCATLREKRGNRLWADLLSSCEDMVGLITSESGEEISPNVDVSSDYTTFDPVEHMGSTAPRHG